MDHDHPLEALHRVLDGDYASTPTLPSAFQITCSRPHGRVAAVLGTPRRLGLERTLDAQPSRPRACAVALIVSRILDPGSKPATSRALRQETCPQQLGRELGLGSVNEGGLYAARDRLVARQPQIEAQLARRHLKEDTLVVYDLRST